MMKSIPRSNILLLVLDLKAVKSRKFGVHVWLKRVPKLLTSFARSNIPGIKFWVDNVAPIPYHTVYGRAQRCDISNGVTPSRA